MSELSRFGCIAGFMLCVSSFVWAMSGRFFRSVGALSPGFRLIQATGALAFIANTVALAMPYSVSLVLGLGGIAIYAASLSLFWWSVGTHWSRPPSHAFTQDTPEHMVQAGPYKWIRHPIYTSYLLAWIAGPVATRQPLLLIPFFVMLSIYWRAARLEECKFAASLLANAYDVYRTRTGMFLPWI